MRDGKQGVRPKNMLFLTRRDIDERRSRGLEDRNLYSDPSPERMERANRIIAQINEVFRDVKLGAGVGLYEGQAIDDYESDEERALKRAKDEKEDWRKIPTTHLNACNSSLSFFDAEGMRFHLPAFICCDLRGEYALELEFSLTGLDDWKKKKFSLLTVAEKAAVAEYLEFLAEDVAGEFSLDAIGKALDEFWKKAPESTKVQPQTGGSAG
jgi:hypothetical protein